MAWGPDGRLYIRLLHNGVASYAYNKTTGTLSDVKQAVTGFPGIGLAFHQNRMYLTTMDESIVKLDDQNGNGIWGESGELNVRIVTHIPTGDHNVDQLLVQGNSLYVGIGTRTTNGYSGDYTAGSFDEYGGQGFYSGGQGKSWGDSAYNGTISWIQDLTAVADIEGSANAYPNSTLTQSLVQQDDSPLVVSATNKLIVHSAGTRNPYGMCFDRLGDLWFTNNLQSQ
jgi:glucose/arabinose dehydrogenase